MKKRTVVVLCTVLFFWFAVTVQAASLTTFMDPVGFYLVDNNGDGSVAINLTAQWPSSLNLDWSYDGTNWNDWSTPYISFSTSDSDYTGMLYLSINGGSDTDGDVTFDGAEENTDMYYSIYVQWTNGAKMNFMTVQPDDAVSPIVPLPAAIIFLSSGLVGLVAVKRRNRPDSPFVT